MRRDTRNTVQIDADRLDLEVFRAVTALNRFANTHRDNGIREMAQMIDGMRHRIRKYMHQADREKTS
jgi:hypothetical protein